MLGEYCTSLVFKGHEMVAEVEQKSYQASMGQKSIDTCVAGRNYLFNHTWGMIRHHRKEDWTFNNGSSECSLGSSSIEYEGQTRSKEENS